MRKDTEPRGDAKTIYINNDGTAQINKDGNKIDIVVQKLFKIDTKNEIQVGENKNNNDNIQKWTTISNSGLESVTNLTLSDYKTRTSLINAITKQLIDEKLNGVIVDLNGITEQENFIRFLIELTPRLREVGISTGVHVNDWMEKESIKKIVDYIVD